MSGPFIFIGTHRVKEGQARGVPGDRRRPRPKWSRRASRSSTGSTSQVGAEHIKKSVEELLETREIQIYGELNNGVLGMIEQLTQAGVPISVKPLHLAGFTR
jgi:hypothetical protein